MRRVSLLLLLWTAPMWGQSVKLPAEVRGEPGTIVVVRADTDCASLRWLSLDAGLTMIPPELLRDGRAAVVMAGRAGRYRLLAYGAKGDAASEPAVCVVTIGDAPTPVPPDPAPTPEPADPLVKALQTAYASEADVDRAALKGKLAALYRQGAVMLSGGNPPRTWGELYDAMKAAAVTLGVSGRLAGTQAAASAHLREFLPTARAKEIGADAGQAAAVFRRLADALEKVR